MGIPWYRLEHFDQLRNLFIDGDILHKTYDEWLVFAEKYEKQLRNNGMITIRVYIEPTVFSTWCLEKGKILNAEACFSYTNEIAIQTYFRNVY